MTQQHEQLATLQEIRSIMDRSSRFISLSGLSGVFAGLCALASAGVVKWYLYIRSIRYSDLYSLQLELETAVFLAMVATLVLTGAVGTAFCFTFQNAQKIKQPIWNSHGKRLLMNLCIPLAFGALFCLVLIYHGILYLVAPAMLIFYGLALINSSKYTYRDIRYLGLCEVGLGLVSCFFIGWGLLSRATGFAVLHIVYGTLMYYKYERA
ncbi:hypothetical protein [Cesiribacter sp. SM1]|uniref:hypothetical protein n=1 Tax=Cesiribacter sp. SM1 TaxID=2861196 RepID=UPI001CD475F4|nr:hypothetical protein [Cesiribacter sp. SM1]